MNPKTHPHPELLKNLPPEVKTLFKVFNDEIRLVGGSVRDSLLKNEVKDYDFATTFLPEQIIQILEKNKIKAVPTGIKFGTITAVVNRKNFEITTLRKDAETDGRHCQPEFIDDYFFDAARRDFTINALYLDEAGFVYDYFDGITDLKNQQVRFIGDAQERIKEDFLRILRFFRFSGRYASKLDPKGLDACENQKENIKKLSRERVRAEFLKMISGTEKDNLITILKTLKTAKISDEIFSSELDIYGLDRLFEIAEKLQFSANLNLKIATLFLQKNLDLKIFFTEICATNLEKKYFTFLLLKNDQAFDLPALKKLLAFEEKSLILDLYLFSLVKNSEEIKLSEVRENIKFLQEFILPNFPLTSADLMQMGFAGRDLGEAIQRTKMLWVESDFKIEGGELLRLLLEKSKI